LKLDASTLTPRKVHFLRRGKGPFASLDLDCRDEVKDVVRLWRIVLDFALADYLCAIEDWPENEDENFETWLSKDNEEFIKVCEYALLEPKSVIELFLSLPYGLVDEK
jgi:hypothetical protein